ncbi:DUF4031 domain-containing protein [Ktedonobacter sp. SOSP1-52]|uniref:DUF4031 domain-containing protein n=1 Tax=Ktedonobacter sp. SOSP1-52 TaxID=2778366 RepID=UPI0019158A90
MIYVDGVRHYPKCKLSFKYWSHMATDSTLEELHTIASKMGLPRQCFHNVSSHPHYDVTPLQRARAIQLGAKAVHSRELIKMCWPARHDSKNESRSNAA